MIFYNSGWVESNLTTTARGPSVSSVILWSGRDACVSAAHDRKGKCPVRPRPSSSRRYAVLRARDSCSPSPLSPRPPPAPARPPWSYEGQCRFEWGIWRNDLSPPFRGGGGAAASSSWKVWLWREGQRGREKEREC